MSYSATVAGLKERLQTVNGLVQVLDYEPSAFHAVPAVYLFLDSFRQVGELPVYIYRVVARLCIAWQENERAEHELIPFVNSIPAAIHADPYLGGRLTNGRANVDPDAPAIAGFVRIGGTMYRSLDVYFMVKDTEAWT